MGSAGIAGNTGTLGGSAPEWLKLQGDNVAALKGAGWSECKGKGKTGKSKTGGEGKGWDN